MIWLCRGNFKLPVRRRLSTSVRPAGAGGAVRLLNWSGLLAAAVAVPAASLAQDAANPSDDSRPAAAEGPAALQFADEEPAEILKRLYRDACMSVVKVTSHVGLRDDITSGFFIGEGDLIATVLSKDAEPSHKVTVTYAGKVHDSKLLAIDARTRLALLRAEALKGPPLPLTSAGDVALGSFLCAVTESDHILSRALPGRLAGREKHFRSRLLPVTLLRLNMPEGPGAFGAPVMTRDGYVAGVLLTSVPEDGDGVYALPADIVRKVAGDFRKHGRVGSSWIGISLEEGTSTPRILECREGSPAFDAGLRRGDIILRIGERVIREYQDVVDACYFLTPGDETEIEFLRGLHLMNTTFTPRLRADAPPAEKAAPPAEKDPSSGTLDAVEEPAERQPEAPRTNRDQDQAAPAPADR